MRRVHTQGIEAAKKHTLMASLCYNLKKLMKHCNPKTKTFAQSFEKIEKAVKKFNNLIILYSEYQYWNLSPNI